MNTKILLPSTIGLLFLGVIVSLGTWNNSNIWIPVTALFMILGVIVFVLRSMLSAIEKRLKALEAHNQKGT